MKDVIRYAGYYERHFRDTCETRVKSESKEALRSKKKQLKENKKHIAKLDRHFTCLYDDNAASQIGDDRFGMKRQTYADEQYELKAESAAGIIHILYNLIGVIRRQ